MERQCAILAGTSYADLENKANAQIEAGFYVSGDIAVYEGMFYLLMQKLPESESEPEPEKKGENDGQEKAATEKADEATDEI